MRYIFIGVLFLSLALIVILASDFLGLIFDRASNDTMTRTRMWVVKRRILAYAHQNNRLPASLAEIPVMPGYDNSIEDGWGRALHYEVSGNGTVTLSSLGRDGLPGGEGDDADIVVKFATKTTDGRWSDPLVEWSRE